MSLIEVNIYCWADPGAYSPGGAGELRTDDLSVAGPRSAAAVPV